MVTSDRIPTDHLTSSEASLFGGYQCNPTEQHTTDAFDRSLGGGRQLPHRRDAPPHRAAVLQPATAAALVIVGMVIGCLLTLAVT